MDLCGSNNTCALQKLQRWWTEEGNSGLESAGLCIANKLNGIWLWWDYLPAFICDRRCGSCLRKFWNEDFFFIAIQKSGRSVHFSFQLLPSWVSFLILQISVPGVRFLSSAVRISHISVHIFRRKHLWIFLWAPLPTLSISSKSFLLDFLGCT